jgi:hypothetical protein
VRRVGGPAAYGYGDTELGAKFRFVHEGEFVPQIGTFPLAELPTGDSARGLGSGQVEVFLPLWLQKSVGPLLTYGGGGYCINPGAGNHDWLFLGWHLEAGRPALVHLRGCGARAIPTTRTISSKFRPTLSG